MEKMTVRTIAKALGVAHSTVHRALSGKDSVSLKKRRRIIQYAQEHGYSLPLNNNCNIAIVVPHFYIFGYLARVLFHLENELYRHGYRMILISEKNVEILKDHMFAGIISAVWQESRVLKLPQEYSIPIISLNAASSMVENIALVASGSDGISLALKFLHSQGCRKIFYVGPSVDKNPIEKEKLEEFRKFCNTHSLKFNNMHRSVTFAKIATVIPDILSSGSDAVFCASETYAFNIGRLLQKHNVRIPEDISLMGMEMEELNTNFDPPITAISQDFENLAKSAVEMLIAAIEDKSSVKNIRIPCKLIKRASVKQLSPAKKDSEI